MEPRPNRGLHIFAVFTACCTFLLSIAGALVTSNDAGLAVPDWPLSFGSLTPPMVGGIFYEHSHRVIVPTVGQGSSRISLCCGCDTCFSLYEFENVGIDL